MRRSRRLPLSGTSMAVRLEDACAQRQCGPDRQAPEERTGDDGAEETARDRPAGVPMATISAPGRRMRGAVCIVCDKGPPWRMMILDGHRSTPRTGETDAPPGRRSGLAGIRQPGCPDRAGPVALRPRLATGLPVRPTVRALRDDATSSEGSQGEHGTASPRAALPRTVPGV